MAQTTGSVRAEVLQRMAKAFGEGLSASKFIVQMRAAGLTYRRTDMLADWRGVNEIKSKEGLTKYVRKDRFPTAAIIAQVPWKLSREFMYKVKVWTQTRPGEPITSRFVNIVTDKPLTVGQAEEEVYQRWAGWSKYGHESITSLAVETTIQRMAI